METKEVDRVEALPVVRATSEVVAPRSRDDMLLMAMDRGYTPEQIAQFMDLRDRHEAREAEKAFNAAMADFKAQPPVIVKDKHVSFASQKGQTDYDHATHFSVTKAIAAALAAHGLSHSWKSEQRDGKIIVTCTVKHRLGHSESTAMEAAYDASGGKNAIQSIGSAKTYLERYTLLGITGLSTQDQPDDDGAAPTPGTAATTGAATTAGTKAPQKKPTVYPVMVSLNRAQYDRLQAFKTEHGMSDTDVLMRGI